MTPTTPEQARSEADFAVSFGSTVTALMLRSLAYQLEAAQAECAQYKADVERYRWLRKQHWSDGDLCVVKTPARSVRLGSFCPSEKILDETIDSAMESKL